MKKEKWDYWNMKSGVQQLTDEIVKSLKEDPRVTIVTNTPCTQLDFQDKKIVVCIIALSFLGGGRGFSLGHLTIVLMLTWHGLPGERKEIKDDRGENENKICRV